MGQFENLVAQWRQVDPCRETRIEGAHARSGSPLNWRLCAIVRGEMSNLCPAGWIPLRVVFDESFALPGERIEEKHGSFRYRSEVDALCHGLKTLNLRGIRNLACVTDAIAHILIVGIERGASHHVVELAETNLPPAFGILIGWVGVAGG